MVCSIGTAAALGPVQILWPFFCCAPLLKQKSRRLPDRCDTPTSMCDTPTPSPIITGFPSFCGNDDDDDDGDELDLTANGSLIGERIIRSMIIRKDYSYMETTNALKLGREIFGEVGDLECDRGRNSSSSTTSGHREMHPL